MATDTNRGRERLVIGVGGLVLVGSLFLPWAGSGDADRNGFELWTMADVFLLIVGVVAVSAAVTGGRIGVFRPDVSLNGATDMLAVVATILLAWLLIFDFPAGADPKVGVFLALVGAMAVAGGAGDYRVLRGAPVFPRIDPDER